MAKSVSLVGYMGPKPEGEKYAARYTAILRDGRVWFSGGKSEHSVSAAIPLKDINAHWAGYCGQGRYKAAPRGITKAVFLAAHKQVLYRSPVNPYAGHQTHFFEAEVRFHLKPPTGMATPDSKAAR